MSSLDSRQQTILRAIIVEYVGAAEPVGSEMIAQKYELGVKSATIRSAMAEMSELGLLEQPHTSAGRIPSDAGYRYFVDHLMVDPAGFSQPQRVSESVSSGEALQTVLRETMSGLSRLTHLMGVATTIRDGNVSVRHAVFSALGASQGLLVLVLSNGHVENRMLEIPAGLTLDNIGAANEAMQAAIAGKDLAALGKVKVPAKLGSPAFDNLQSLLWSTIKAVAKDLTRGVMIVEGEEFMFAQPEFQRDLGALNELLTHLKESDVLYESIAPGEQTQTVTIGRENRHHPMRHLSIIRNSFYVGSREVGVVALVGPTRMRYEVGVPLINFTANALSQSLTRLLA